MKCADMVYYTEIEVSFNAKITIPMSSIFLRTLKLFVTIHS